MHHIYVLEGEMPRECWKFKICTRTFVAIVLLEAFSANRPGGAGIGGATGAQGVFESAQQYAERRRARCRQHRHERR